MNATQALKKVRSLLCRPSAVIREDRRALVGEARIEAGDQAKAAHQRKQEARRRMDERTVALQLADAEYQAAKADWDRAKKEHEKAAGYAHIRRYTAGWRRNLGDFGCFHVEGEGDTLAELVASVEKNIGATP